MNAIVHFSVGLSCGMFILLLTSLPSRVKFPLVFASGVWAMVPDGWHLAAFVAPDRAVILAYAFHRSILANVFWFHQLLDRFESGEPVLEMTAALGFLSVTVVVFTALNTWE